ncbi:hypothetical protein [Thermocatellispora tengchongensis]|uniref:hypothetical protein n=1 Tax=Thermocatellispora tengchongensis TaxID=1073253 RepID=UPI00362A6EB3
MSRARHALTALVLSAAALTTATALAAPAYAVGGATVSVQSGIMIVQGTAESDTIEINPVSGGVSVSAPASQRVTPSTGCFTVTPSKVTCTGVSSIQVNLFGGDDNGNNNTSLPTIMAGSLGGDTLSGGDGRDDLRGDVATTSWTEAAASTSSTAAWTSTPAPARARSTASGDPRGGPLVRRAPPTGRTPGPGERDAFHTPR